MDWSLDDYGKDAIANALLDHMHGGGGDIHYNLSNTAYWKNSVLLIEANANMVVGSVHTAFRMGNSPAWQTIYTYQVLALIAHEDGYGAIVKIIELEETLRVGK